jgi:hypothetical protein
MIYVSPSIEKYPNCKKSQLIQAPNWCLYDCGYDRPGQIGQIAEPVSGTRTRHRSGTEAGKFCLGRLQPNIGMACPKLAF